MACPPQEEQHAQHDDQRRCDGTVQQVEPLAVVLGGEKQGDDAALIQPVDDQRAQHRALELVPPGCLEGGDGGQQQEHGFRAFAAVAHRERSVRRDDAVAAGLGAGVRRDEVDGCGAGQHRGEIDYQMLGQAAAARRISILQHEEEQQEYQGEAQFNAKQEGVSRFLWIRFDHFIQGHGYLAQEKTS